MQHRLLGGTLLLLVIFCESAAAEGEKWFRLSSPNFLLFTDTTEAKGRRLLADFEARTEGLSRVLGPLPARQFPIEVFLFDEEPEFIQAAPRIAPPEPNPNVPFGMGRFPDPRPDKNGYVYKGPDRVFVVAKDKSPEDIADHAAHALGHVLFERYVIWRPFWLSEAAAEYVRRLGRDADKKTFSETEGFTVEDLLTIVPSGGYNDAENGGAFRALSYRLLRILSEDKPEAIRSFLSKLKSDFKSLPSFDIDAKDFEDRLRTYVETPLPLTPSTAKIEAGEAPADTLAIHRGDVLIAAGRESEAGSYYNASSKEARAARAIVIRFTRSPAEAARVLDRASQEVPDHGLLQYHFGAMAIENPKDVAPQVSALERAVKLLPLMGRAHAELARVYALSGQADKSMELVARAFDLEPEFADRFYEIRADVNIALGKLPQAFEDIQTADNLPHLDKDEAERVSIKVMEVRKRIEGIRREAEDRRLQELRRQVDAEVALREPPPRPEPPPPPVPEGMISYQIEARSVIEVTDAVYPDYPEELRKSGTAGDIVLQVTVGANGKVTAARVLTSKAPPLNAATTDAVKKWTFSPGAAGRIIRLIVSFRLQ